MSGSANFDARPQTGIQLGVETNATGAQRVGTISIGGFGSVTGTQGAQGCVTGYAPNSLHVPYTGSDGPDHKVFDVAENLDGSQSVLGRRTVTFNNAAGTKPFGTIDTPAQGETVSGTIVNNGWVLTPAGKMVPLDGSTIKVYVDGTLLAPVTAYNRPRPDVKAYFPGLANSNGPEARLSIDTTLLADGVHTIAWGVIDDAGAAEGIGSRYFTVQNGSGVAGPGGGRVPPGIGSTENAGALDRRLVSTGSRRCRLGDTRFA